MVWYAPDNENLRMKRLNPETNVPFKWGDARSDGKIFKSYQIARGPTKEGFYSECWYSPETFEAVRLNANKNRKKATEAWQKWLRNYKSTKSCVDCGYDKHIEALHFDHLPGVDKKFCISRVVNSSRSRAEVEAEIAKCEIVCANCHAIRTATRREANALDWLTTA